MTRGAAGTGPLDTPPAVLAAPEGRTDSDGMGGFTYRTACNVVMVGTVGGAGGRQPRPIGPAHATISRVSGAGGKKALCGAFVAKDEQVAWPPPVTGGQLCPVCAELATL